MMRITIIMKISCVSLGFMPLIISFDHSTLFVSAAEGEGFGPNYRPDPLGQDTNYHSHNRPPYNDRYPNYPSNYPNMNHYPGGSNYPNYHGGNYYPGGSNYYPGQGNMYPG